jgi:hypothetical protein
MTTVLLNLYVIIWEPLDTGSVGRVDGSALSQPPGRDGVDVRSRMDVMRRSLQARRDTHSSNDDVTRGVPDAIRKAQS